jgi:UPF0716 protein FxsA
MTAVVGLALFVMFILVPLAELIIIFKTAGVFGWLDTIAVLVLISVAGAWLVRRAGLKALIRTQRELAQGKLPTNPIIDGLIVLVAGALMLTPGFLTDAVGLLLLLPPVRIGVRSLLVRRYRHRLADTSAYQTRSSRMWFGGFEEGEVIDVDSFEITDREIEP